MVRFHRVVADKDREMRMLLFLLALPFAVAWALLVLFWRLIVWLTVFGSVVDWLDDDC